MNIKKSNDHSRYSVCSLLIRTYVAQILLNEAWPEKKCILSFWHFKTYQIGDPLCSSCSSLLIHASSPNLPSLLVFQLHLAKLEESIVYIQPTEDIVAKKLDSVKILIKKEAFKLCELKESEQILDGKSSSEKSCQHHVWIWSIHYLVVRELKDGFCC